MEFSLAGQLALVEQTETPWLGHQSDQIVMSFLATPYVSTCQITIKSVTSDSWQMGKSVTEGEAETASSCGDLAMMFSAPQEHVKQLKPAETRTFSMVSSSKTDQQVTTRC